jgi:hypothetical protein
MQAIQNKSTRQILNTIAQGDCIEVMRQMTANSADFILTDPPYLSRPIRTHHPERCQCLLALKSSRGSNDSFKSTVVGLNDVVEILACAMLRVGRHFSFSLQPGDGFGIGPELVCRDRRRWTVAHSCQRFSEETIGRTGVPSVRQHEVDQPAVLIDRSEQYFHFPPTFT